MLNPADINRRGQTSVYTVGKDKFLAFQITCQALYWPAILTEETGRTKRGEPTIPLQDQAHGLPPTPTFSHLY